MDEILRAYARCFDHVHYIGPGSDRLTATPALEDNITVSTVEGYGKPLNSRVSFFLRHKGGAYRFRELLSLLQPSVVQLRIPGLFPLAAYPVVRELGLPLTSYISTDWPSAFSANRPFPGARLLGELLDFAQRPVIRRSAPVAAGPVLAARYAGINPCHPYLSTTHREVRPRAPRFPPRRLLFVGRVEPLKRLGDALEALALLRGEGVEATLDVVGDGVLREREQAHAGELGLGDAAVFHGRVADTGRLSGIYSASDVLVLPSLSEGTPKVLPEAMAHGAVPIAAASAGSVESIVTSGVNGLIVPPRSPRAIADAVCELRRSRERFAGMVEAALRYAAEHTIDREVEAMWRFVRDRLEGLD